MNGWAYRGNRGLPFRVELHGLGLDAGLPECEALRPRAERRGTPVAGRPDAGRPSAAWPVDAI